MEADLTFRALICAVDDYGRIDARPAALKATLYPMRDAVTPAKVEKWIAELVSEGCAVLYWIESKPILQLTGWEKHRGNSKRSIASKYPEMQAPGDSPDARGIPGDPLGSRESGVDTRESGVVKHNTKRARKPKITPASGERFTPPNIAGIAVETLTVETAEILLAVHPRGVNETPEALAAWFAKTAPIMVAKGYTDLDATARNWWPRAKREEIEAAHEWVQARQWERTKAETIAFHLANPRPSVEDDPHELDGISS